MVLLVNKRLQDCTWLKSNTDFQDEENMAISEQNINWMPAIGQTVCLFESFSLSNTEMTHPPLRTAASLHREEVRSRWRLPETQMFHLRRSEWRFWWSGPPTSAQTRGHQFGQHPCFSGCTQSGRKRRLRWGGLTHSCLNTILIISIIAIISIITIFLSHWDYCKKKGSDSLFCFFLAYSRSSFWSCDSQEANWLLISVTESFVISININIFYDIDNIDKSRYYIKAIRTILWICTIRDEW